MPKTKPLKWERASYWQRKYGLTYISAVEIIEIIRTQKKEAYKDGYNQRLKDEGKVGERWQHLYL